MATKGKNRQRIVSKNKHKSFDQPVMRRCRWLGYSHKIVDYKRKKEAKKENIIIVITFSKKIKSKAKGQASTPCGI